MLTVYRNGHRSDEWTDEFDHVALYVRGATEESTREQLLTLATYWSGADDPLIFIDNAVSGLTPFTERPEARLLLAAIDAKKIDTVAVLSLDRLARSLPRLIDALTELTQRGVRVVSATQPFDTSDVSHVEFLKLLTTLHDLEGAS